jgi:hypothetical protein
VDAGAGWVVGRKAIVLSGAATKGDIAVGADVYTTVGTIAIVDTCSSQTAKCRLGGYKATQAKKHAMLVWASLYTR